MQCCPSHPCKGVICLPLRLYPGRAISQRACSRCAPCCTQSRCKIRVVCARAYHCMFMHNMLIRPTEEDLAQFGTPDFTIFNAGAFPCNRWVTQTLTLSLTLVITPSGVQLLPALCPCLCRMCSGRIFTTIWQAGTVTGKAGPRTVSTWSVSDSIHAAHCRGTLQTSAMRTCATPVPETVPSCAGTPVS